MTASSTAPGHPDVSSLDTQQSGAAMRLMLDKGSWLIDGVGCGVDPTTWDGVPSLNPPTYRRTGDDQGSRIDKRMQSG